MRPPRSIAIINPLSDYGINAYAYELAEGLAANDVHADVYTGEGSPLEDLPKTRNHRCFPVLGSLLSGRIKVAYSPESEPPALSNKIGSEGIKVGLNFRKNNALWQDLRQRLLSLELAAYLRWKKYDLIWTQWPEIYGFGFWRLCKMLGVPIIHTVHNVLSHEESPDSIHFLRNVYHYSDILFVHSDYSRNELLRLFPECAEHAVISLHGMYTVYPRRPGAREPVRKRLGISDNQIACLVCGGIRPYKNIESSLAALADPRCKSAVLIVAGQESGYPDSSSVDPLGRTRRIAENAGITERVRLLPGFLHSDKLVDLFEAADILLVPYLKGYGSGLLLLGMTFGKRIVATNSGALMST